MSAEKRALGEPERLHPFFLLTGLGAGLRGLTGAYALIAYLAVSGRLEIAILGALGLLAFSAIALFLYWSRFEFRVGDEEIRIDSGIVSRTHRSIPFDRIQDVDISQGPIARLLGLAKVTFETGGSALAGQEEGVLQAITLERAEELRTLVRSRRSQAPVAQEAEAERPPVYAMDSRRLLLAGAFNFSLALFAGLFGLSQTMGDVLGFDPLDRDFWRGLLSRGDPVLELIMANAAAAAAAGVLLLVLIGVATGIVRTVLRDYGFRLDRTEVGLRRRRGLLTRTDVTVRASRAQAAVVATGVVRDSLGWRELRLQSLARDEGEGGDHVLAPLARDEEVDRVLAELGWRPLPPALDWTRVSRAYVHAFALMVLPLVPVALLQIILVPALGIAGLAVLAALVLVRRLEWRRIGYALDGDRLLVRNGWWRRRTLVLPLRRIQSIDVAQSFVGRWFGTASLVFGIAGGSSLSIHNIPAVPEKSARELRDDLLSSQP